MSGCERCPSDEVFVDDANAFSPSLPAESLCFPCCLEVGA